VPTGSRLRGSLYGRLVDTIGRQVITGELPAGATIYIDGLVEEHGISRPMVRECLRMLESKGLVEARPRIGTRVLGIASWNLLDPDVIAWRMAGPNLRDHLAEMMDLREAVEPVAARMATTRIDAAQLAFLRECAEGMRVARIKGDYHAYLLADVRFHDTLLVASGNKIFAQLSHAVESALRGRQQTSLFPDEVAPAAVDAHFTIVECMERADPAAAEEAAREQLRDTREEIEERGRQYRDRAPRTPARRRRT
jgi:DNA-binding FadR family transcriptional regulator